MNRAEVNDFGNSAVEKRSSILDSGWRVLADAIILKAVDDYRRLLRRQKKHPYNLDLDREVHRIERFFRSNWFGILCDLDGRKLLKDLRAEVHK